MRNVGIIGIGYTPVFVSKRKDVNIPEMISEAVENCYANTGLAPKDVDAMVFGNMHTFEGVNMPHLWAADHIAALGKPVMRIATGGSTGMSAIHAAYYHIASGMHDVVMVVCFEKQSEGDSQVGLMGIVTPELMAMLQAGIDVSGSSGMGAIAGGSAGAIAFQACSYLARSGAGIEHIDGMAALERRNAAKNPYAHLKDANATAATIAETPLISYPIRFGHICPTSDGATVAILASEEKAAKLVDEVAWIHGIANCASDASAGNILEGVITDPAEQMPCQIAAKQAYKRAGIEDPKKEIDYVEIYNGFAHQTLMFLEKLGMCEVGEAHKLLDAGDLEINGRCPVNASGGVVSTNAIGTSAMNRVTECALQILGRAGEHQVEKDVHKALAHGWGGLMQYVTVTILADAPQKS
jgi:acetyl-CoA C-acetyltransferase